MTFQMSVPLLIPKTWVFTPTWSLFPGHNWPEATSCFLIPSVTWDATGFKALAEGRSHGDSKFAWSKAKNTRESNSCPWQSRKASTASWRPLAVTVPTRPWAMSGEPGCYHIYNICREATGEPPANAQAVPFGPQHPESSSSSPGQMEWLIPLPTESEPQGVSPSPSLR